MSERTIAFLVYPDMTPLDLVGPLQVIKPLELAGAFEVVTVGASGTEGVNTDIGLRMVPERTYEEVPEPWGVVVPGGLLGPYRAMVDDALMAWLRRAAEGAEMVASVCTGALVLAAAGVLDGRRATTHWAMLDQLGRLGAIPVRERWVRDGHVITAAGVSAGIDMALELVAGLTDEATARTIQLLIEYEPSPPHGGIDWSLVDQAVPLFEKAGGGQIPQILAQRPDLLEKLF